MSAILNHHARMEDIDITALAAQIGSEQSGVPQAPKATPGKKKAPVK